VGTTSGGETFSGTLAITGVAVQDGQAYVLGTLAGTPVAVPVQAQGDPCTLVSFSLGPIDLNVAGLIGVHIDPIGLDVTLSGLLGDLLCPLLGGSGGSTPPPVPA
jgi:hypothetical protein